MSSEIFSQTLKASIMFLLGDKHATQCYRAEESVKGNMT